MTDPDTIFQRTHTGREEIHKKSHGLTQSERLVLIMVDGVSSYQQIRAKLPVLTDERFGRALQKLQLKELVLEVFMPVEGQAPDELERTVIDRFLQQDPMDPVTIILRDPEEELELLAQSKPLAAPVPMPAPEMKNEDFPTLVVPAPAPGGLPKAEPAIDALHAELADSLAAEFRAKRALKPPAPRPEPFMIPDPVTAELSPFLAVHWGYWLIVSGLSFILGFVLARVTS